MSSACHFSCRRAPSHQALFYQTFRGITICLFKMFLTTCAPCFNQMNREMEERACSYQTGMTSEFLVMSMLFRLGLNPQLTLGNNKRVDIFVPKEEEGEFITIDVKSVRAFNSIPVGNVKARKNHFVVVVIYKNKFEIQLSVRYGIQHHDPLRGRGAGWLHPL